MVNIDQEMLNELAKDFGAVRNVKCDAETADMVSDNEVFVIDQVGNWQDAMDHAVRLAKCLNKEPALILTGETSAKMVDEIDQKVWDQAGISVRFTQYCTISDISDVFMTSEEEAERIVRTIAKRHDLENKRSGEIFNYIDEIWGLIKQDDIFGVIGL